MMNWSKNSMVICLLVFLCVLGVLFAACTEKRQETLPGNPERGIDQPVPKSQRPGNGISDTTQFPPNQLPPDQQPPNQQPPNQQPPNQQPPETGKDTAVTQVPPGSRDDLTLTVSSRQPWTDTGITVSEGDVITITASGNATYDSSGSPVGPEGSSNPCGDEAFVVIDQSVPAQSLVGNIASEMNLDGKGFFVGSRFTGTVPVAHTSARTGKLFLGFNDGAVNRDRKGYDSWGFGGDNNGSFTVTIKMRYACQDRKK